MLRRVPSGPGFDEAAIDCNNRRTQRLFVAGVGGQESAGDQGTHCGCSSPSALRWHWPLVL